MFGSLLHCTNQVLFTAEINHLYILVRRIWSSPMNHPEDSSQPDAPFSSLCGHGLKHGLANMGLATPREEIGKVEFVEEFSSCDSFSHFHANRKYCIWKVFTIGGTHSSLPYLPWLWEEGCRGDDVSLSLIINTNPPMTPNSKHGINC